MLIPITELDDDELQTTIIGRRFRYSISDGTHAPYCNAMCSMQRGHWLNGDMVGHAHDEELRAQCAACGTAMRGILIDVSPPDELSSGGRPGPVRDFVERPA